MAKAAVITINSHIGRECTIELLHHAVLNLEPAPPVSFVLRALSFGIGQGGNQGIFASWKFHPIKNLE